MTFVKKSVLKLLVKRPLILAEEEIAAAEVYARYRLELHFFDDNACHLE